ncbi:MAG: cyclopropane-fatty-acyl-phospholipid synthase family protein [Chryseolinea sp.]
MESSLTRSAEGTSDSLWQSIVLGMLQKMNRGKMVITLPSGYAVHIGDGMDPYHAEMTIRDMDFFKRCVMYGDIGFGETYVDGLWDTPNITKVISWFLFNVDKAPTISGNAINDWAVNVLKFANRLSNIGKLNTKLGSKKNISDHYDLNNEFFSMFLDSTMTYSAAYFKRSDMTLEEAQYEKYDALSRRVRLKSTDHVLEIGTGWGGNAIYMAKNFGCRVTTTTISAEQHKLAVERVANEGLSDRITVLLKDYRDLEGTFDKIVSIEMLEAVGHKFLKTYFAKVYSLLKKDGLLGIQVITSPDSRYANLKKGVDWIQKHIFPGSLIPSVAAINQAVNETGEMTLVDLQDLGKDYATTLRYWYDAFNANWPQIKSIGFDDRFRRKWNYYLCYCEAAFDMRNINVMQLVYSRPNNLNW